MRLILDGEPAWLPADWVLDIASSATGFRIVRVLRPGSEMAMTLAEAVARFILDTSASKPHVRAGLT